VQAVGYFDSAVSRFNHVDLCFPYRSLLSRVTP
jgi:hypothetical protein